MSRATLRLALLLFGLSRVVAYSLAALVPGPWRGRLRFQRDAYVGYVRSMLSRRSSKSEGVSA